MANTEPILGFFGSHHFLSNFYLADQNVDMEWYASNEHFYQAMKTTSIKERRWVASAQSPGLAKKRGRSVTLRSDWEDIKVTVMRLGLRAKFYQNPELAKHLLFTDTRYLEETNTWGDTYWGVCDGVGQNVLGRLLMELRHELSLPRLGVEKAEQLSFL